MDVTVNPEIIVYGWEAALERVKSRFLLTVPFDFTIDGSTVTVEDRRSFGVSAYDIIAGCDGAVLDGDWASVTLRHSELVFRAVR